MPNRCKLLQSLAVALIAALLVVGCAAVDQDQTSGPAPVRKAGEASGTSTTVEKPGPTSAPAMGKPGAVVEEDLGGQGQGSSAVSPVVVRQVQGWLNALRFDAGPPDGKISNRTTEAVRKYQKQKGLPVDGKITEALRDRLRNEMGVRQPK